MAKKEHSSKLSLGISLILMGILLFGSWIPKEKVSSDTFAKEPIKVEGFDGLTDEMKVPERIIIPNSEIDLDVERAKVVDGYWEVFADKAGWGEGSGLPGENGNQVIFAHAREGLFLPLRSIELGAKIYVLTRNTWYSYEVSEIRKVKPNQVDVISPTEDEILTLYTCSGFRDSERLIVVAKRD